MLPILPIIAVGAAALAIRNVLHNRIQLNDKKTQYQALNDWFLKMKLKGKEDSTINPNARSANGVPALILAIEDKRFDIVQTLLQIGANPNAMDNKGRTALHLAGRSDIVQMLLRAGADPDAQDEDGKSAIFYPQSEESLRALKNAGADFTLRDSEGRTALHQARSSETMMNLLLYAEVDPNAQDKDGKSAIFYPQTEESLRVLKDAGADFNLRDFKGRTALFHTSSIRYAKALIRMGCNPDIEDYSGNKAPVTKTLDIKRNTVEPSAPKAPVTRTYDEKLNVKLDTAIEMNDPDRVSELLKQGANPNYTPPGKFRSFMLQKAIKAHSSVIVECLLKYGAIAYPTVWNTALLYSSLSHLELLFKYSSPRREALCWIETSSWVARSTIALFARNVSSFGAANDNQRKKLIEAGGRVDALDAHGRTALFYVKNLDVIVPLINAGIDPRHIDKLGKTPLFYLDIDDPLNILIADKLIECGVNPDICDRDGQKAPIIQNYDRIKEQYAHDRELEDAVEHNNLDKAKEALQNGANPNCQHQSRGDNMLMLATFKSSIKMIDLLLKYGADPNRYDVNSDTTALIHAQTTDTAIRDMYRKHGYEF